MLYTVGWFIELRRYATLKLPGATTVASLSRDPVIGVGARHLLAPFVAAGATAALFVLLVTLVPSGPRSARVVGPTLAAVALITVVLVRVGGGNWENAGFVLAIEGVAVLGWFATTKKRGSGWWPSSTAGAAGLIALAVASVAAAFVLVHVWRPPVDLEYVEVTLRNNGRACGIYLALTDNDIYIAPAEASKDGYKTRRVIVALPRTDVLRFTLSRKQHVRDGGPPAGRKTPVPACAP